MVRASFLIPLLESLDEAGTDTNALAKESGLTRFEYLETENCYLKDYLYLFLAKLIQQEQNLNFVDTFSPLIRVSSLGQIGRLLLSGSILQDALQVGQKLNPLLLVHATMTLAFDEDKSTLTNCCNDSDQPGRDYVYLLSL